MTTDTHDDPIRIFSPASGLPLVSHQRFPADGLFGDDELTVTPPPPMISLTASRVATPGTLTDCPCWITEDYFMLECWHHPLTGLRQINYSLSHAFGPPLAGC